MMELRQARIARIRGRGGGRLELELRWPADPSRHPADRPAGGRARAVALDALGCFPYRAGDRVWVNVTARCLRLGSGGVDFVVAPAAGRPAAASRAGLLDRRHGHIMKLRYTPLQLAVQACEEPGAPYHRLLRRFHQLQGFPVAILALHSMVAPCAAAFAVSAGCGAGAARPALVLTDSAALPAAVSDWVHDLLRRRLVAPLITCGQAFGGQLEAVHAASALVAASRSGAPAALVAPGPGVVGTATLLGTSCLEVAALADLVAALGGTAVVACRLSFSERRLRHRGVSHHLQTALGMLAWGRHWLVLPAGLPRWQRHAALSQLARCGILGRHRVVEVPPPAREHLLPMLSRPWQSMGKQVHQEPALWDAAAACGRFLAWLAQPQLPQPAG